MKLMLTAAAVFAAATVHADPINAIVRVALSDGQQYDVTVARNGTPTAMMVHDGAETIELRLRVVDGGRLRYEVKRAGAHSFTLDGETAPPRGRPALIGHIPYAGGACDVRLRMTDD
jgi:hypothetical protein